MSDRVKIPLSIMKRDDERRVVFGFAKFSEDPGNRGFLHVDKQGDYITPDDLEDSAYQYVLKSRDSGEMHVRKGAATLVESVVITPEKLQEWGMEGDEVPISWWAGYKVAEPENGQDDPWDKIKKGEYTGFSVEGTAVRQEIEKANPTGSEVHSDKPVDDEEDEDEDKKLEGEDEEEEESEGDEDEETTVQKRYESALLDPSLPAGDVEEIEKSFSHLNDSPEKKLFDAFMNIFKHEGEDHPQSSHGNRLFSSGTDPVGDLMKRLKTRYKRTDATTLRELQKKFSKSSGEKDRVTHDELVMELVRRNLLKPSGMKFKTKTFQDRRDQILRAVTEDQA